MFCICVTCTNIQANTSGTPGQWTLVRSQLAPWVIDQMKNFWCSISDLAAIITIIINILLISITQLKGTWTRRGQTKLRQVDGYLRIQPCYGEPLNPPSGCKDLVINFYCFPHKPQRMPPPAWSSWQAPSLRGEGSSTSWRGVSSSAHRPRPRDDRQHRPLLIRISEQILSQINNVCFVKQCHLQYEIIRRVVSNFIFIIWLLTFTFLLVYHFHSCSCFQESIGKGQ